jgi:N-acyl-D-aspartate/D-glutamate deacylase
LWAGNHYKAVEEAIEIGRRGGVAVQVAHQAIIDSRVWGEAASIVPIMEQARADGIDVTYDVYPYTAAGTGLQQLVPEWAQDGGVQALVQRLRDPETRRRVHRDMSQGWFRGLPWEHDKLVIAYVRSEKNQEFIGKSIADIATSWKMDPVEVMLTLIDEEDNHVNAVMHNRVEEDVRFFMRHPLAMIGSDGRAIAPRGLWANARPHPRFYGTYPRVLGRYVREERVLSLAEAVYKMTGFPADRMGITDRGRLVEGVWADVVVFDPDTVIDRATFEDPQQYPVGIPYVLVNGQVVVEQGEHTGKLPGRVLRKGSSAS